MTVAWWERLLVILIVVVLALAAVYNYHQANVLRAEVLAEQQGIRQHMLEIQTMQSEILRTMRALGDDERR